MVGKAGGYLRQDPPPPPTPLNTANEGRFRLNVAMDSPWGARAIYGTHARPSAAPGAAAPGFHFPA